MIGLTPRQNELLTFISAFKAERGRASPSLDEMKEFMGVSSRSAASRLIDKLEERGCIRRVRYLRRSIEIIEPSQRTVTIKPRLWPLVERYAAMDRITIEEAVSRLISDQLENA